MEASGKRGTSSNKGFKRVKTIFKPPTHPAYVVANSFNSPHILKLKEILKAHKIPFAMQTGRKKLVKPATAKKDKFFVIFDNTPGARPLEGQFLTLDFKKINYPTPYSAEDVIREFDSYIGIGRTYKQIEQGQESVKSIKSLKSSQKGSKSPQQFSEDQHDPQQPLKLQKGKRIIKKKPQFINKITSKIQQSPLNDYREKFENIKQGYEKVKSNKYLEKKKEKLKQSIKKKDDKRVRIKSKAEKMPDQKSQSSKRNSSKSSSSKSKRSNNSSNKENKQRKAKKYRKRRLLFVHKGEMENQAYRRYITKLSSSLNSKIMPIKGINQYRKLAYLPKEGDNYILMGKHGVRHTLYRYRNVRQAFLYDENQQQCLKLKAGKVTETRSQPQQMTKLLKQKGFDIEEQDKCILPKRVAKRVGKGDIQLEKLKTPNGLNLTSEDDSDREGFWRSLFRGKSKDKSKPKTNKRIRLKQISKMPSDHKLPVKEKQKSKSSSHSSKQSLSKEISLKKIVPSAKGISPSPEEKSLKFFVPVKLETGQQLQPENEGSLGQNLRIGSSKSKGIGSNKRPPAIRISPVNSDKSSSSVNEGSNELSNIIIGESPNSAQITGSDDPKSPSIQGNIQQIGKRLSIGQKAIEPIITQDDQNSIDHKPLKLAASGQPQIYSKVSNRGFKLPIYINQSSSSSDSDYNYHHQKKVCPIQIQADSSFSDDPPQISQKLIRKPQKLQACQKKSNFASTVKNDPQPQKQQIFKVNKQVVEEKIEEIIEKPVQNKSKSQIFSLKKIQSKSPQKKSPGKARVRRLSTSKKPDSPRKKVKVPQMNPLPQVDAKKQMTPSKLSQSGKFGIQSKCVAPQAVDISPKQNLFKLENQGYEKVIENGIGVWRKKGSPSRIITPTRVVTPTRIVTPSRIIHPSMSPIKSLNISRVFTPPQIQTPPRIVQQQIIPQAQPIRILSYEQPMKPLLKSINVHPAEVCMSPPSNHSCHHCCFQQQTCACLRNFCGCSCQSNHKRSHKKNHCHCFKAKICPKFFHCSQGFRNHCSKKSNLKSCSHHHSDHIKQQFPMCHNPHNHHHNHHNHNHNHHNHHNHGKRRRNSIKNQNSYKLLSRRIKTFTTQDDSSEFKQSLLKRNIQINNQYYSSKNSQFDNVYPTANCNHYQTLQNGRNFRKSSRDKFNMIHTNKYSHYGLRAESQNAKKTERLKHYNQQQYYPEKSNPRKYSILYLVNKHRSQKLLKQINQLCNPCDSIQLYSKTEKLMGLVERSDQVFDYIAIFGINEKAALQNYLTNKKNQIIYNQANYLEREQEIPDIKKIQKHFDNDFMYKQRQRKRHKQYQSIYYKDFNQRVYNLASQLYRHFPHIDVRKYFGVNDLPTKLPTDVNRGSIVIFDEIDHNQLQFYLNQQQKNGVNLIKIGLMKHSGNKIPHGAKNSTYWFTKQQARDTKYLMKKLKKYIQKT